jgi:hypothetical protein
MHQSVATTDKEGVVGALIDGRAAEATRALVDAAAACEPASARLGERQATSRTRASSDRRTSPLSHAGYPDGSFGHAL